MGERIDEGLHEPGSVAVAGLEGRRQLTEHAAEDLAGQVRTTDPGADQEPRQTDHLVQVMSAGRVVVHHDELDCAEGRKVRGFEVNRRQDIRYARRPALPRRRQSDAPCGLELPQGRQTTGTLGPTARIPEAEVGTERIRQLAAVSDPAAFESRTDARNPLWRRERSFDLRLFPHAAHKVAPDSCSAQYQIWVWAGVARWSATASDASGPSGRYSAHVRQRHITGGGRGSATNRESSWVNKLLGNVKNAITGMYDAIRGQQAPRYLAEFEYRFNRRHDLETMIPRFLTVAART